MYYLKDLLGLTYRCRCKVETTGLVCSFYVMVCVRDDALYASLGWSPQRLLRLNGYSMSYKATLSERIATTTTTTSFPVTIPGHLKNLQE